MAGHDDHEHGHEDHHDHEEGRSTAPQSEYTMADVRTGLVVALVGLILVLGVPVALTL
jgi:hypothetical protein